MIMAACTGDTLKLSVLSFSSMSMFTKPANKGSKVECSVLQLYVNVH